MKRLFVALTIEPEKKLIDAYNDLHKSLSSDKINWVKPDRFHLTLKFIGETPDWKIPEIEEALKKSISNISDFNIVVKSAGIFGSRYNPRVIWLGISKNSTLDTLAKNIAINLDIIGIKNDRQNFVPHITMGRIKNIFNKQHLREKIGHYNNEIFQTVEIIKIDLYESVLSKAGPNYYLVNSFNTTNKQANNS